MFLTVRSGGVSVKCPFRISSAPVGCAYMLLQPKICIENFFRTSNVPYSSFRQDVCEMSFPYIQRARWLRLYVTAKDMYNSVHRLEFIHRMCSRYASTSAAIRA